MTKLKQAEARLAQLQGWLEGKIATRHSVALRDVLTTAIEVGRLRALAEVADVEYHLRTASFALRDPQNRGRNVGLAMRMLEWADALAAREEVQE